MLLTAADHDRLTASTRLRSCSSSIAKSDSTRARDDRCASPGKCERRTERVASLRLRRPAIASLLVCACVRRCCSRRDCLRSGCVIGSSLELRSRLDVQREKRTKRRQRTADGEAETSSQRGGEKALEQASHRRTSRLASERRSRVRLVRCSSRVAVQVAARSRPPLLMLLRMCGVG